MMTKKLIKRAKIILRATFRDIKGPRLDSLFHKPLIIAHRGYKKRCHENTREAINNAVECQSIDGVELDIRMTKDGVLVIHHDESIDRTSNGTGKISDLYLKELKQFNFNNKRKPETILTLEEALMLANEKMVILHLKTQGSEIRDNVYLESIKEHLNSHQGRVICISFSKTLLQKLKVLNSSFDTVQVFKGKNNLKGISATVSLNADSIDEEDISRLNGNEKIILRGHSLLGTNTRCQVSLENIQKIRNHQLILITNYPVYLNIFLKRLRAVKTRTRSVKEVAYEQGF